MEELLSLSFYEKVPFQINLKRKFYISFSQNLVLESQCRLFLQLAKFSQIQLFGFICFDGLCVKCVVSSIVVVPIILTLAGELQTKLNLGFHTQLSTLEEKRKLVGPSLTAACYIVRRLFIHRLPTILCPDNCHNLVVGQIGHSHQAEDTPVQIGARCFQTNVFAFHIIHEIWRGAGLLKRRCKHECFLGFRRHICSEVLKLIIINGWFWLLVIVRTRLVSLRTKVFECWQRYFRHLVVEHLHVQQVKSIYIGKPGIG